FVHGEVGISSDEGAETRDEETERRSDEATKRRRDEATKGQRRSDGARKPRHGVPPGRRWRLVRSKAAWSSGAAASLHERAPKLTSFGAKLDSFEAKLTSSGAKLDSFGAELASYGAKLDSSGAKLTSSGAKLASFGAKLSSLGAELSSYEAKLSSFCALPGASGRLTVAAVAPTSRPARALGAPERREDGEAKGTERRRV